MNYVDLHTHSNASDGLYSPTELLRQAKEAGLRVLALTDHDTTNGLDEAAQAAAQQDIDFIPGIEFNADVPGGAVHVLGYFLDYRRPAFQQTLQALRDFRVRRGERMVERLNALGIPISWERVREIAHGAVGRPHVAQALIEAGYAQSVDDAFAKYLDRGRPAYVRGYKLSPEQAVRLIASANGLPVMAHPLDRPGIDVLLEWLPGLSRAGLVGLETYYGPYTPEQEQTLLRLCAEYDLIPTGGSDYHGPGLHPTPLGGHHVPYESVERLRAEAAKRRNSTPPVFILPPPEDQAGPGA